MKLMLTASHVENILHEITLPFTLCLHIYDLDTLNALIPQVFHLLALPQAMGHSSLFE